MAQFSEWFIDFFKTALRDIGWAFRDFFIGLYNFFIGNPIVYFKGFLSTFKDFSGGEKALSIFAMLVALGLYVVFIYAIYIFVRKYLRFIKKEKTKEALMKEITRLSKRAILLEDEKNAMLALSSANNAPVIARSSQGARQTTSSGDRFAKLSTVDELYNFEKAPTIMKVEDELTLKQLIDRFIAFSASQLKLYYNRHTVISFFAGLATSKTVILEGISGTGKTSLPYAMGKFFSKSADIISVQPSWRDRAEMMGYLNEFTKKFNETEFLRAVYEAGYRNDINLIVLDEMNLARVEYYFADFLSLLEMPHPSEWLIDLVPEQLAGDPFLLDNGKMLIPQNIWFIGTANKDDSTFTITDKVYDRAISIEINHKAEEVKTPYAKSVTINYDYLNKLFNDAVKDYKIDEKLIEKIIKLDEFVSERFQITFGNRIMKQVHIFVPVYVACGGLQLKGLDQFIARKIIRKFETLNLPFMQQELEEFLIVLEKLFGKDNFDECKNMVKNYLRQI